MKENEKCTNLSPLWGKCRVSDKRGANKDNQVPRLTAVLPPQGREMSHGFTLIELLVVVLIIGILAAVALPQYNKATEKIKAAQSLTLLPTLYQAAETYYLTHGSWPSSVNDLDVDISLNPNEWQAWIDKNDTTSGVGMIRKTGKYAGAGFAKYDIHAYSQIPTKTILCLEQGPTKSTPFTGSLGDYCIKIWGGKNVYKGTTNVFSLP